MYKKNIADKTSMRANEGYIGEPLEAKLRRILSNKEPIKDSSPLVYTERKEGVRADMDIRTDRWDVAINAMDTVAKAQIAKREARGIDPAEAVENGKTDGTVKTDEPKA